MRNTTRAELARLTNQQARAEHEDRESYRRKIRRNGGYRAPRLDAYPMADDAMRAPGALYQSGTDDETAIGFDVDLAGGHC